MNECKHKHIKFFEAKNKVVCLDCGEGWSKEVTIVNPVPIYIQPYVTPPALPTPFTQPYSPGWPTWPIITCGTQNQLTSGTSAGAIQ